MSKKDIAAKELMKDSHIFADVFNYYLYGGKQIIKPDDLRVLDTDQVVMPYKNGDDPVLLERFRDKFKSALVMSDDNGTYVLLGIENQSYINYAMPVRNMLYDAMRYTEQVEEVADRHKEDHDRGQRDEFMSGFKKIDRIKPIITLTILWGPEKWDGATSLYEMFDTKDENILKYIPNYNLNLLTPEQLQEEDFELFATELGEVLFFLKYSKNKKEIRRFFDKSRVKRVVRRKTLNIINTLMDTDLKADEGEEEIDLCIAIEGIKDDARNEGIAIGIEKGSVLSLYNLVKNGIITIEIAASQSGIPVSEFEAKAKEYTKENEK